MRRILHPAPASACRARKHLIPFALPTSDWHGGCEDFNREFYTRKRQS